MKFSVLVVLLVALLSLPTLAELVRPDDNGYIGVWSEINTVEIHWAGELRSGYSDWRHLVTGEIIRTPIYILWNLGVRWDYSPNRPPMAGWGGWYTNDGPVTSGEFDLTPWKEYIKLGWAQWVVDGVYDYVNPPSPTISWELIGSVDPVQRDDRWLEIDGIRAPVPEPSSILFLGGAVLGFLKLKRRV